jgi:hypothetical protein
MSFLSCLEKGKRWGSGRITFVGFTEKSEVARQINLK